MVYQIDRLTNFVRNGETRLAVTYSKYADEDKTTLLAQNHSINITLSELDSYVNVHINALNAFALAKLEENSNE